MRIASVLGALLLTLVAAPVGAQQGPIETVMEGCKPELETYCSQVRPGQQRILAFLDLDHPGAADRAG